MKRETVISSNLASVGYDTQSQTLEIEFNHGGIYQYFDVPQEEYDSLINADSIGSYFYHNIRDAYEYAKL